MNDTQVYYGGAIKDLGNGKVGGYLVLYGDATKTDLTGDYFTPDTDFDLDNEKTTTVYYQHGLDPQLKRRKLGTGVIKRDDVGVWVEAQLKLRDDYERAVYGMVQAGKMGWSSGTAAHLVERESVGKSYHITRWALGLDASITPTPAEPRTQALNLKSIPVYELKEVIPAQQPEAVSVDADSIDTAVTADNETPIRIEVKENDTMSEEQTTNATPPLDMSTLEAKMAEYGAKLDSVLKHIEESPRLMKAGVYSQDGGAADSTVKSFGDYLLAIKRGDIKRLQSVYKTQTEASATGGGYLVPEQFFNELIQMVQEQSPIVARVRTIPVASPSGQMPALDQFLTPGAGGGDTAMTAGINTNKRSETGAYAKETAAFTNLEYRVYDSLSGYVRTSRELSEDAPAIESLLRQLIAASIQNKLEYFILFGSGVGEPLGVLNANNDAAVSVDAATDNAFVIADVMNIMSHFKGMGQPVWVAHPSTLPDIGTLSNGSGAVSFTSNLQSAMSMSLMGYPIVFSEHMAQTNNPKDIALIDFSMYYLFTRGAAYIDFSRDADFLNGNDTWRFGQRIDGKPALKNRITLADAQGSFYVSPYVFNND